MTGTNQVPARLLANADKVVVFTGAGVSAESGIPTFRDRLSGLWERFDPSRLATPDAFLADPELVWGWYEWRRMQICKAKPNAAHIAIAELAARVPDLTVITQNVDDLHERAGSIDVLHLHGSLHTPRCFDCSAPYPDVSAMPEEPEAGRRLAPPRCRQCSGMIRPGVVWFGESLPEQAFARAFDEAGQCDLLLSIGTSGLVQPAAHIPALALAAGASVIHINPQSVDSQTQNEHSLTGAAGEMLPDLIRRAFSGSP
ncbi:MULTISPECIES: NAD-dependent deacylase [Pseudomonas]|uniref:SIR2 family NAD-dependent protein deacylase n=1 Tax=Pseudomonas TaxID=286 RepID=UPI00123A9CCC|nr:MULTISPECIES: NAD-dependent deacylase [Pseudomonas]QIB51981.1 NAD-dependent deacylase [Pseudomonas sp. OIL-1]